MVVVPVKGTITYSSYSRSRIRYPIIKFRMDIIRKYNQILDLLEWNTRPQEL